MIAEYFEKPSRIAQLRKGGDLLESFVNNLFERHYGGVAARKHIRVAEHFIYWTTRRGISSEAFDSKVAEGFLTHLERCRCSGFNSLKNAGRLKCCLDLYLRHLRSLGVVLPPKPNDVALEPQIVSTFCDWMRQQRGVTGSTLDLYRPDLLRLVAELGADPRKFEANTLRRFILEKAQHSGNASTRTCIAAVRMFLRFLISQGDCPAKLYASIPRIASWRLSALPRYLQAGEVERVVDSCNLETLVGRRDRVIILLLARLGLRAGDIVQLRLGDLNWDGGTIRVSGKGRRQVMLPLTQEIGEALANYIKDDRPPSDTDAVFVRSSAPHTAFADSSAVSMLVRVAMRRAGVTSHSKGAAHIFRHSVATSMLRQGASLQDISVLLRHRSIETTQIYAKVDVVALSEIAQPWPEVTSC
jgi:site-specific recombinase XerD